MSDTTKPPSSEPSEKWVLSAFMKDSALLAAHQLAPEAFHHPAHRTIYRRMLATKETDVVILGEAMAIHGEADFIPAVSEVLNYAVGPHFDHHLGVVRECFHRRLASELAREITEAANDRSDPDRYRAALAKAGNIIVRESADLAARRFDIENPPPRPVPLLSLGDHVLCTAGNISNVQAPAKAGKSAVIGAIIAAIFDGNRQGSDTLGFSAENPDGKALIHFDTEQSRHDHHALVVKSLARARLDVPPPWFMSFSVADMSIPERLAALEATIQRAAADHGGVFAVIVDGIADLVFDPNDSAECFALVGQLHTLAIKHEAAIITVLHENPGAVEGKTRGHLGSQLERKAETNLRLAKDSNGITTIFAERARHAYIPKDAGACFQWSHAAGMHVSCGDAGEIKRTAKREKMEEEAAKVFVAGDAMRHGELVAAIMEEIDLENRAARGRVKTWKEEGIIIKEAGGKYRLAE
jgi:hypothetical protein